MAACVVRNGKTYAVGVTKTLPIIGNVLLTGYNGYSGYNKQVYRCDRDCKISVFVKRPLNKREHIYIASHLWVKWYKASKRRSPNWTSSLPLDFLIDWTLMLISNSSLIRPNKQFRCRNQLSMRKETPCVRSPSGNISNPVGLRVPYVRCALGSGRSWRLFCLAQTKVRGFLSRFLCSFACFFYGNFTKRYSSRLIFINTVAL